MGDPVTQGVVAPYGIGYAGYGKRSADPFYGYGYAGYPAVAAVPFGSSTGLDPITQGLDPVTQGVVAPYGIGYAHYGKRSADPYYGVLPYAGHAVAAGVAVAGVPFGSSTGLDPITQGLDPVTQGVVAPYGIGYAGYGKRSADPFYGYG